ncbi:hypothetical protein VPH35_082167 [Triticum aestivum]
MSWWMQPPNGKHRVVPWWWCQSTGGAVLSRRGRLVKLRRDDPRLRRSAAGGCLVLDHCCQFVCPRSAFVSFPVLAVELGSLQPRFNGVETSTGHEHGWSQ